MEVCEHVSEVLGAGTTFSFEALSLAIPKVSAFPGFVLLQMTIIFNLCVLKQIVCNYLSFGEAPLWVDLNIFPLSRIVEIYLLALIMWTLV